LATRTFITARDGSLLTSAQGRRLIGLNGSLHNVVV